MEGSEYRLAAVFKVLPVRLADGGEHLLPVFVVVAAPFFPQLLLRVVRLAAVRVVADVGLRVVRVHGERAAEDEAPRGHGLGLQRVRLEERGHLRRDNARQVVRHVHALHLPAGEDGELGVGVRPGGGRALLRLSAVPRAGRERKREHKRYYEADERRSSYSFHTCSPQSLTYGAEWVYNNPIAALPPVYSMMDRIGIYA